MLPFSKGMELQAAEGSASTQRLVSHGAAVVFLKRYWPTIVLVVLMSILYGEVIRYLIADWYKNGDDAHGFFVLAVSAYLVWRKRKVLPEIDAKPSLAGLPVVLGSLGLLFLGHLGAEFFLSRVSLLTIIIGVVVYFRGWQTVRVLAFPFAFSLLMIPLPGVIYYQIVFPLQLLTSRLAIFGLECLNLFPVIREGNLLFLPHHTLEVVEACSGVRSLMALLALALGYGYLAESSKLIRGLLVLLVVPLAILSNALRVMIQAVIARYQGVDITDRSWHQTTGMLTFLSAALLMLLADRLLNSVRRPAKAALQTS